jgi:hypothetical protein
MMKLWSLLLFVATVSNAVPYNDCTNPDEECDGNITTIDDRLILQIMGKPNIMENTEIARLERHVRDTYNAIALSTCLGGSFYEIEIAKFQVAFVDSTGDRGGDGNGTAIFNLRMRLQGFCLGCDKDNLLTYDNDDSSLESGEARRHIMAIHHNDQRPWEQKGETSGSFFQKRNLQDEEEDPPPCPICNPPSSSLFLNSLDSGVQFLKMRDVLKNIDSIISVTDLNMNRLTGSVPLEVCDNSIPTLLVDCAVSCVCCTSCTGTTSEEPNI